MTSKQFNILLLIAVLFAVISLLIVAGIVASYLDTFHATYNHTETIFDSVALIVFPLALIGVALVKGWRS